MQMQAQQSMLSRAFGEYSTYIYTYETKCTHLYLNSLHNIIAENNHSLVGSVVSPEPALAGAWRMCAVFLVTRNFPRTVLCATIIYDFDMYGNRMSV